MRIILIFILLALALSTNGFAQDDFITLDKKTYEYYLQGDYNNLKTTAQKLFSQGSDYYYLRMRLGICAFNLGKYHEASTNLTKALAFNTLDTISNEYIYKSYLLSGRKADADLFLFKLPEGSKNSALRSTQKPAEYLVFLGSSVSGFTADRQKATYLFRESLNSSYNINAGFETRFLHRFTGTLALTSFTKSGMYYSSEVPNGTDFLFDQAQIYAKLGINFFPGWEVSLFGHSAILSPLGNTDTLLTEYNFGAGISKNWWKLRTGANVSFSNFSNSRQIREEGFISWLPYGNLNLYFTTGGMYQYDINWGSSWQLDQEIGFKISRYLWIETGITGGNSFLYTRSQGYVMNNSYQIPGTVVYTNFAVFPLKKISFTLSPFFAQYQNYSWMLSYYKRTDKNTVNSFGGTIKITYNIK